MFILCVNSTFLVFFLTSKDCAYVCITGFVYFDINDCATNGVVKRGIFLASQVISVEGCELSV